MQIRRLLERIGIRSTPAQQSTWSDSDEAVQNQLRKERLELKKELERFHGLYEIAGKFYHIDGIFSGYPENWNNYIVVDPKQKIKLAYSKKVANEIRLKKQEYALKDYNEFDL